MQVLSKKCKGEDSKKFIDFCVILFHQNLFPPVELSGTPGLCCRPVAASASECRCAKKVDLHSLAASQIERGRKARNPSGLSVRTSTRIEQSESIATAAQRGSPLLCPDLSSR